MTSFRQETVSCAVCGTPSEYTLLSSTNAFGPPDLDTRPAEMMRSTLGYWVQCCPHCGYCAPRVDKTPSAPQALQSKAYKQQRFNPAYPSLANAFLCHSLVEQAAGKVGEAGWAALHAAWVCDDARFIESARRCRLRAVELLRQAQVLGQAFGESPAAELAILSDLLRRSGRFREASRSARLGLQQQGAPLEQRLLAFTIRLCEKQDAARYTLDDLPAPD